MDCTFFLLLGCWISWTPVITLGGIALMPNTSLNCPGPIQFTCVGTDIPNTLIWRVRVNDIDHRGEYAFNPSHTFPRSILLNPSLPGVEVLVINVSISNQFRINIASTLTSTAMLLNGATIQCADGADMNSTVYRIDVIAPPTCPFLECSHVVSPGGVIVSFDSFSSGNNVTNYRVVLSPTPSSSCPSEQLLSPSEDYSCSGLVLGTRYSFNVSAINCGNQEGAESTIIVHPQIPLIPEIVIFATYNDENSLSQLTVTWQVKHLSISDVCSFDNSLNYSIFLEDGRGGRLEERMVNSDNCNNNLCSTSFNISSSSNQSYLVSIHAVNAFGQSNTAELTLIGNSLRSEVLSLALTFKDCVTTLLCSSDLTEGSCVVQYGRDSSYENLNNHLNVSLNSPFPLPLIDALTQYYFQVEVRINSTFYRSRRSFMTGEFAMHLTDANIGLLIISILFLILGILTLIVWLPLFRIRDKPVWIVSLVILLVAVFLWLVSVCLWIAVGDVVGSQRNTCVSIWQSNRDNLIIAAFVLSFISLLLFIISSAVAIYQKVHFKEKTVSVETTTEHNSDLHNAAKEGNLEEVKHLIAKGLDPLTKNSDNDTTLHTAARFGKLEVIKYLTENLHYSHALPGWHDKTPLHSAAEAGHFSIVQYLMDKHKANPLNQNEDGYLPLHSACIGGSLEIIKHLIQSMLQHVSMQDILTFPTKFKTAPIHIAALKGHTNIIKFLIEECRCDPNLPSGMAGRGPLFDAAQKGHLSTVKYLIAECGCDPGSKDINQATPLHLAAQDGHLETVKYLTADRKCNSTTRNNYNNTPMHNAASNGHSDVVEYFITVMQCSPHLPGQYGRSPLHHASSKGHLHLVKNLIEKHGCDPNIPDNDKFTPLHLAAEFGHLSVVEHLTKNKDCIIMYQNKRKNTPLHSAAIGGHLAIVKHLVEQARCPPNIKNSSNQTTLQLALAKGHSEVVDYLCTL